MGAVTDKLVMQGLIDLSEGAVKIFSGTAFLTAANAIDTLVEDELRGIGKRVIEILDELQPEEEAPEETPVVEETKAEEEE